MNEQEPVNTVLSREHFLTSYVNKAIGHRGITAHTRLHSRGNTATCGTIPAALPQHSSPLPRETRGYRGNPAIPITVQLSTLDGLQQMAERPKPSTI